MSFLASSICLSFSPPIQSKWMFILLWCICLLRTFGWSSIITTGQGTLAWTSSCTAGFICFLRGSFVCFLCGSVFYSFFLLFFLMLFLILSFFFFFWKKKKFCFKVSMTTYYRVICTASLDTSRKLCFFFFFKKEVTNSLALEACLASMLSPFSDEYFQACPSKHQLPPLNTSFTSEATDA